MFTVDVKQQYNNNITVEFEHHEIFRAQVCVFLIKTVKLNKIVYQCANFTWSQRFENNCLLEKI